jgi:hypothetical protein
VTPVEHTQSRQKSGKTRKMSIQRSHFLCSLYICNRASLALKRILLRQKLKDNMFKQIPFLEQENAKLPPAPLIMHRPPRFKGINSSKTSLYHLL